MPTTTNPPRPVANFVGGEFREDLMQTVEHCGPNGIPEPGRHEFVSFHFVACGISTVISPTFLSVQAYSTGNNTSVRKVELSTPPMMTVANGRCTSAPAPVAMAIGTKPR